MNDFLFLDSIKKMPLMDLPVRSVFVPTRIGGVLISPGSCLSTEQMQALPGVTEIVAPNLLHCAGVAKAASVFSSAKKWGPLGVSLLKPQISWDAEFQRNSWPHEGELEAIFISGMPKINEVVFFHKATKSLIVTDLCFNLTGSRGMGAWVILNLFGTYNKLGVSKFFLRSVVDKNAFKKSIGELFVCDFENIIVSHGENVIGNGRERLKAAFEEKGIITSKVSL